MSVRPREVAELVPLAIEDAERAPVAVRPARRLDRVRVRDAVLLDRVDVGLAAAVLIRERRDLAVRLERACLRRTGLRFDDADRLLREAVFEIGPRAALRDLVEEVDLVPVFERVEL